MDGVLTLEVNLPTVSKYVNRIFISATSYHSLIYSKEILLL